MSNGNATATTTTALAKSEPSQAQVVIDADYEGLRMVVSPAEALRRVQELQAFVKGVMVPGVDYGVIPGAGDKPTLYQPGAQKLAEVYGFAWSFEDSGSVQDWAAPLFIFRKRCALTSRRNGHYIGDGIGSCNSKEDRYAWRWVFESALPKALDRSTLRTKRARNNGILYRVPNEDVFSLVNTIEKMACKRALVHAVLGSTRSSGVFTQDVEDLPREVFGQPDTERSWERGGQQAAEDAAGLVAKLTEDLAAATDPDALAAVAKAIKAAKIPEDARGTLRGLYAEQKKRVRAGGRAEPPPQAPGPQPAAFDEADIEPPPEVA